MRSRIPALALVALLAVAACSGGGAGSSATAPASSPGASAAPSAASGKADCATLKKAAAKIIVGIQLLAQMRSPESVQAVKDKVVGDFDPDDFIAAMQQLHALDGSASPLGDPKTAIDNYIAAAQAAKTLLAKSSVTQADVDAYLQKVGTISDFLGGQLPITGALSAAGC